MRATQSHDTILDGAFCPDENVICCLWDGTDWRTAVLGALFAWALFGMSSLYYGAARRAFDITVAKMPQKTSVANLDHTMAYHPEVQHNVAEMRMSLDICEALIKQNTSDWANGVEHEDWPIRIIGTRFTACQPRL